MGESSRRGPCLPVAFPVSSLVDAVREGTAAPWAALPAAPLAGGGSRDSQSVSVRAGRAGRRAGSPWGWSGAARRIRGPCAACATRGRPCLVCAHGW